MIITSKKERIFKMKTKIFIISLILAIFAATSSLPVYAAAPSNITVEGHGIYEADPDYGELFFTIEAKAENESEAKKLLDKKTDSVLSSIKNYGSIKTDSFFTFRDCDGSAVASRSFVLSSNIPSKLPDAQNKLISAGASSICAPIYFLKNRSAAEKKALEAAIADAKERAKTCGASGDPISLHDMGSLLDCCRFICNPVSNGKVTVEARIKLSYKKT